MLLEKFGLQLYSVSDMSDKDFLGTIKDMASLGYKYMEFAGYYNKKAEEVKSVLDNENLVGLSAHNSIESLENEMDDVIAYSKALGLKYVICPWADMETKEDALNLATKFNKYAKQLNQAGLIFASHNHAHEFKKVDGVYLQDIVFENVDRSIVKMQLDLFWLSYAGVNIVEYCTKNIDVLELIHIKQINFETKKNVNLPDGDINYPEVIAYLLSLGVKYFIVEQENYAVSSRDSAAVNAKYLMNL